MCLLNVLAGAVAGIVPGEEGHFFLSYCRQDDATGFVSRLQRDLVHNGVPIWMDKEDIPAGTANSRAEMGSK